MPQSGVTPRVAGHLPLLAILALSLSLNLWNIGFPLGYHVDEPVKVGFITSGTQDFKHPILMLQLARVICRPLHISDKQLIVVIGRTIQACAATVTVWLMWLLARRVLAPSGALAVAASVAVSPILVMHAHYLKEDTLLTTWLVAAVVAFATYVDRPTARAALMVGLVSGLAFSSHYKSVLLVPLFLAAPSFGALVGYSPSLSGRLARFCGDMALAGAVASAVFLAVNWPLLWNVSGFLSGPRFELQHAIAGEDALYRISDFWFTYHLRRSLAPGMSWPALAVGLAGMAWLLSGWKRAVFQDRLVLAYVLLFYFVPEASPLKSERYMVPVAPALLYLGWRVVDSVIAAKPMLIRRVAISAAGLALIGAPLYRAVRLTSSISPDTRERAAQWLAAHPGKAIVEYYASLTPTTWMAGEVDPAAAQREGVDYIVVSSLSYDRYLDGATLPNQDPEIYRMNQRYRALFTQFPYVEILPAYETYEFTNPVIRILDIRRGATTGR